MNRMHAGIVIAVLGVFVHAACRKSQPAGGSPEAAQPTAGAAGGAGPPGEGSVGEESPPAAGAAASAGAPAGGLAAGVAAAREGPREFPCPPGEQERVPSQPDPEAGDFTVEEALAGLAGSGKPVATIDTTLGTMRCTLEPDKVPHAVANFVGLARGLRPWWDPCARQWVKSPYYDGLMFHRVIPGFMAQGGDPYGDGTGGPGYEFANEIDPDLRHDRAGTLAYANAGPDTNGSQFYVTVGRRPQLDGGYVVFGYCEGVDVVEGIVSVPRDPESNRPDDPVWIRRVTIERLP